MPIDDTPPLSDPLQAPEHLVPTQTDDSIEDNPFLAMVTEQSQWTPDDVHHILSVNKVKQSEKVKDPVTHNGTAHVTYRFAQSYTSSNMQHVDRVTNED